MITILAIVPPISLIYIFRDKIHKKANEKYEGTLELMDIENSFRKKLEKIWTIESILLLFAGFLYVNIILSMNLPFYLVSYQCLFITLMLSIGFGIDMVFTWFIAEKFDNKQIHIYHPYGIPITLYAIGVIAGFILKVLPINMGIIYSVLLFSLGILILKIYLKPERYINICRID